MDRFSIVRGALGVLSRTSPGTASRIAADLFMSPRRHGTPAREQGALEGARAFDVHVGVGSRVKAWRWDAARPDAPVVLLVHGWEGRGSQLASFVRPLLAAGASVVTFDAPGHGASDGKRSSLPHFTWGVRCVADAVGGVHAIVAHSLGCAAVTLALRDGFKVQRLVYLSPPLEPIDYIRRFGGFLGLDAAMVAQVESRIEERFLRKWQDYSLSGTARSMTVPLLVIHDRDDAETRWDEGAAIAAAWPGAQLITTSGLGHRRILRDPAVLEATAAFCGS